MPLLKLLLVLVLITKTTLMGTYIYKWAHNNPCVYISSSNKDQRIHYTLCRFQAKQACIPGIVASSTWVLQTILGESPENVIPT